ncbi:response regulator [Mastigocladus laminosus UU774]|nr:response regulator [Mastigocladus laminosus UU774]
MCFFAQFNQANEQTSTQMFNCVVIVEETEEDWKVKEALQQVRDDLENRVKQRTRELLNINQQLQKILGKLHITEEELHQQSKELTATREMLKLERQRYQDLFEQNKNLEKQFLRAQRLENLGSLASGIAHDLNNVFTPILMISQLLPLKLHTADGQIEELLEVLRHTSKRGSDLVKQILAFARGTEERCNYVQLGHLLLEAAKVTKQTFPKSIEISTQIPTTNLWMVDANATQLHQILMNLCVNARDAMPNGGILKISAENQVVDQTYAQMYLDAREGNYVVVTISDTGIGIPPEFMEHIFDPFFTTKETGQGTGLGLSTVLSIVKNHGGFVQVLSEVNKGTKFKVYLPAANISPTNQVQEEDIPKGNGELILIVDDEVMLQQVTQASLEEANYKTLLASNGIEVIALYAQHKQEISVVFIDMMMPTMDGLIAMRTLQKLNPQVKIIATSGLPIMEQQSLSAGAKAFLPKPYTAKEVLKIIHQLIL